MGGLRAGAALSEHPLATHAVGECVGQLLDAGGHGPDLLVVFVTPPLAGVLEDVVAAARGLLAPGVLLACTSASVHGGARAVEHVGAVAMFAAWGVTGGVRPVRIAPGRSSDDAAPEVQGHVRDGGGTLLLLADPFSTGPTTLLAAADRRTDGVAVLGGFASGARGPGGNLMVLDDAHHRDGAVGALFPPSAQLRGLVSQGTRPIGEPLTVTAAERNVVRSLAGAPALERLRETVARLSPEDRSTAARALYLGRVLDEGASDDAARQVLVRPLLGADRDTGAVAVGPAGGDGSATPDPGDEAAVGATVQFHLRDAASVDADLRRVLEGHRAAGSLLLTGDGRGSALFGTPDHDPAVVSEALLGAPIAGMGCAGELSPVGRSNRAHTGSAVLALFGGA